MNFENVRNKKPDSDKIKIFEYQYMMQKVAIKGKYIIFPNLALKVVQVYIVY